VSVSIREATAADVEAMLALWDRAGDPGRTIVDEEEGVGRLLASPSGTLLVAEVDGHILGTVVVGWDGWRGNLYRLVVAGEQRRRGVARALVTEAERRLRAVGCPRITALVHLGLPEAPMFWTAAGYQHDEPTGRFVRNLD
jgi:ribosomal protein S18 acetylase RimI-like enzyme